MDCDNAVHLYVIDFHAQVILTSYQMGLKWKKNADLLSEVQKMQVLLLSVTKFLAAKLTAHCMCIVWAVPLTDLNF